MAAGVELRPTIDRRWLEAAARREPVAHGYALWDLDRFPDRIRVVSAVRREETIGYLVLWDGLPGIPVVHWYGTGPGTEALFAALPSRPLVAIVPPEVRAGISAARGEGRAYPELMTLRPPGGLAPPRPSAGLVRRLVADDALRLWDWAGRQRDRQAAEYPGLDPGTDAVWGAFLDGRLVGAARAAVRRAEEWIVAGVYVEPEARRRGLGEGLVAAVVAAGEAAGARVGLFVREDRAPARRLYERLGFRTIGRRIWLDLGAGLEP